MHRLQQGNRPLTPSVPSIVLSGDVSMPQLGLGTWRLRGEECEASVRIALQLGYRSIDTASQYGNERAIGSALARSDLPRDDLFITSKLPNDSHRYEAAIQACRGSLDRLGLERLDLYLIHWPLPSQGRFAEAWRALQELHRDGCVRAIGVSNFTPAHLALLIEEGGAVPAVNQVELHPEFGQFELRDFHAQHGVATEAWKPLGRRRALFDHPEIVHVARAHDRTPAQVVLRWSVQNGNIVIPKSAVALRLEENLAVFDFALTPNEMERLGSLDVGLRVGEHPNEVRA